MTDAQLHTLYLVGGALLLILALFAGSGTNNRKK